MTTDTNGKVLSLEDQTINEDRSSFIAVAFQGKGTSAPEVIFQDVDPLKILVAVELFQNRRLPLRGITKPAERLKGRSHFLFTAESADTPFIGAARYECSDDQAHAAIILLRLWAEQMLLNAVFEPSLPNKKSLAVPKHYRR